MLSDFKKFVLRGNVVDLAVAVVVGVAFTAMITAFVADLITPLIAAIFGKQNFSNLYFTWNHSTFKYGSFINAVLSFLIIATVVVVAAEEGRPLTLGRVPTATRMATATTNATRTRPARTTDTRADESVSFPSASTPDQPAVPPAAVQAFPLVGVVVM